MKRSIFLSLSLLLLVSLTNDINAQRGGRGRGTPTTPATNTNTGGTNTGNPNPTNNRMDTTKPKSKAVVKGNKVVDTARYEEGNTKEYGAEVAKSRRNGYGYQKESLSDRQPLPYDHIREDDAAFSHFVWREIDAREKINLPFIYNAKDETGDQRFFSILLNAIKNDGVVAFQPEGGDRFTTPMTYNEVMSVSSSKANLLDTIYQPNVDNEDIMDTIVRWKQNDYAPKPDSVYKFRIKEQWMFDRESSRFLVRIIGIAPLAPERQIGKSKNAGPPKYFPLFWIYYPDLRPTLSRTFAYNPKNIGGRLTWEEMFEGRFFSSYIIKSTLDNPSDKSLAQLVKDPLFQLLEGENIKEKLFNYEQDLWAY